MEKRKKLKKEKKKREISLSHHSFTHPRRRRQKKLIQHAGYHKAASLLMPRIEEHIDALAASGAVSHDATVWFVGHSMGASLATLGALRWTADLSSTSSSSPNPNPNPSRLSRLGGVYLLSSPRVMWNDASQRFYNARVGAVTVRFSYQGDVVADAPPRDWGYLAVGSGVAACADDELANEPLRLSVARIAMPPVSLTPLTAANARADALAARTPRRARRTTRFRTSKKCPTTG